MTRNEKFLIAFFSIFPHLSWTEGTLAADRPPALYNAVPPLKMLSILSVTPHTRGLLQEIFHSSAEDCSSLPEIAPDGILGTTNVSGNGA